MDCTFDQWYLIVLSLDSEFSTDMNNQGSKGQHQENSYNKLILVF